MTRTTVTVRIVGDKPDMFAAFVALDDGPEVRVNLDPWRKRRRWGCSECGRDAEPPCVHADLADLANELRSADR